jgi:hypothetical protein
MGMKLKLCLDMHFIFRTKFILLHDCSLYMTMSTEDKEIQYRQFTFSYLIGVLDVMIHHSCRCLEVVETLCKRSTNGTAQIPINLL